MTSKKKKKFFIDFFILFFVVDVGHIFIFILLSIPVVSVASYLIGSLDIIDIN